MADAGTRPRFPVVQSVTSHQSPSDAWRMTTLPGLSESWPSASTALKVETAVHWTPSRRRSGGAVGAWARPQAEAAQVAMPSTCETPLTRRSGGAAARAAPKPRPQPRQPASQSRPLGSLSPRSHRVRTRRVDRSRRTADEAPVGRRHPLVGRCLRCPSRRRRLRRHRLARGMLVAGCRGRLMARRAAPMLRSTPRSPPKPIAWRSGNQAPYIRTG